MTTSRTSGPSSRPTRDTAAAIYVPAGMRHCPITYREVTRPHNFVAI